LDLAWQDQAEDAVETGLADLDRSSGRRERLQGAFVALAPASDAVLAMVGGRANAPGAFNRAYQARRQCGSAIKPIVYAAAFAGGGGITPATTIADTLHAFGRGRDAWTPHNFDEHYESEVTVARELDRTLKRATTN